MKTTLIKFKELKEKYKKKFLKENEEEEIDSNQLILIPLIELKDLVKRNCLK